MKKKRGISVIVRPVIAILLLVVTLFPIYWMFSLSIRPNEELMGKMSVIPQELTGAHYKTLFVGRNFGRALVNSTITTGVSLVISLVCGLCCAYILARQRFRFRGKGVLTYWVLLVRVLPPISFAIPLYLMFSRAGVLGSLMPVISACVFINIPLTIWFVISFFQEIPMEVEESAKIDGATEWQQFVRIVLPLVLPGIAAVAMLSFIYAWNEYTYSVIFVQSPAHYTVPLTLANLNTEENLTQFGLVAAGGVISLIPMGLFVAFAQKYLISGLSSGAVKG